MLIKSFIFLQIFENQETSYKNLDFWLLLKNQKIWPHRAQIPK